MYGFADDNYILISPSVFNLMHLWKNEIFRKAGSILILLWKVLILDHWKNLELWGSSSTILWNSLTYKIEQRKNETLLVTVCGLSHGDTVPSLLVGCFSSVAQSCPTLCDPMNRSTPGLPIHHQLPEFTQTHAHQVGDTIEPSRPLSSPAPPAPNPSQHQGLSQCANSSQEVAKVLEFQRSMGFFRQEYWSGLPFTPPGDFPDLGIEPKSLARPAVAGRSFTAEPLGKPMVQIEYSKAWRKSIKLGSLWLFSSATVRGPNFSW